MEKGNILSASWGKEIGKSLWEYIQCKPSLSWKREKLSKNHLFALNIFPIFIFFFFSSEQSITLKISPTTRTMPQYQISVACGLVTKPSVKNCNKP